MYGKEDRTVCDRPVSLNSLERKEDITRNPWFTVLIADGIKDSQGDILFMDRGTTVVFEKEMKAITGSYDKNEFGTVLLERTQFELKAKFKDVNVRAMEPMLKHLTPSINARVVKKNGSFIEAIIITAISFDHGPNSDGRIKTVGEQYEQLIDKCSEEKCESIG